MFNNYRREGWIKHQIHAHITPKCELLLVKRLHETMVILLCFLGERGAQKLVTRVTGEGGCYDFCHTRNEN